MEINTAIRKDIFRLNKQMYHQFQKDWGIRLPSVTQAEIHEQLFLLFDDVTGFIEDCRNKIMANIMRQAEGIDNIMDTLKSVIDKLLFRLLKEPDKEIYSENHLLDLSSKRFQIAIYMLIDKCIYSNNKVKEKVQFLGVMQVIVWEV
jgi:flagellin-specific chaperone FliS